VADQSYWGWSNEETYAVGNWVLNDEPHYDALRSLWLDLSAEPDRFPLMVAAYCKSLLMSGEDMVDEVEAISFQLFCYAWNRIDWTEISKALSDSFTHATFA
jgi:hypothetical protein